MSQAVKDFEKTLDAGADLSTKQFYIVKLDSNANLVLGAAGTDKLVGVLQNKPQSGEGGLFRFSGTTKVVAGGTITAGAWITSDGSGKAIATTTDKNVAIGQALEGASSGDIFEVLLSGPFTLSV